MNQYSMHTDPTLVAAVRDVCGWNLQDRTLFTLIRTVAEDGERMTFVFDADCELNVKVTTPERGSTAFDFGWAGSTLDDNQRAARIGHALQLFFENLGALEGHETSH